MVERVNLSFDEETAPPYFHTLIPHHSPSALVSVVKMVIVHFFFVFEMCASVCKSTLNLHLLLPIHQVPHRVTYVK